MKNDKTKSTKGKLGLEREQIKVLDVRTGVKAGAFTTPPICPQISGRCIR
jgi:hypothetical protein